MDSTSPKIKMETTSKQDIDLEESSILSSMARLQEMHIRLRKLRETIPSLVKPVYLGSSSPENLYQEIAVSAADAMKNLQSFTKLMREPKNQDVFIKAEESRKQDDQGIMVWLVTQHEDLLDSAVVDEVNDLKLEEDQDDDKAATKGADLEEGSEDLRSLLEKFRVEHRDVQVSMEENEEKLKVSLPPPACMYFQIDVSLQKQPSDVYTVMGRQDSTLHRGILYAINKRPKPDDLSYLLDMLASYSNVLTRDCLKCGRLLNRDAQFPVTRVRKRTRSLNGTLSTRWEARHPDCL